MTMVCPTWNDSMSNLPLRFALRYLFARKSHNVINII